MIDKDVTRWIECCGLRIDSRRKVIVLLWLLFYYKEFRNVFYVRAAKWKHILCYLRPEPSLTLSISSDDLGPGIFIQHGTASYITAEHIGENCWINQQVTIGYNDSNKYGFGRPWIGDNVRISCGALVLGGIRVGDNATIGANAVVIKDVPAGATVVPAPMLIREEGMTDFKRF